VKIELDGSSRSKQGFVGVGNGLEFEVNWVRIAYGGELPFEDDSIDEVFSSHFLQRYSPFRRILNEICRVCKLDSKVEMHVPHWMNSMAMAEGQRFTFSEQQVRHLCVDFVDSGQWTTKKRLHLEKLERIKGEVFKECQGIFPHLTDDQILRFIPEACHEVRFFFRVVNHP
jgi:ubiquinone/menaquinone biosynthesis C-methylase UbiE